MCRLSRSMFPWNFRLQKLPFVRGVVVYRQPSCRCQKQPWTNTKALYFGNTMSGEPGSFLT